MVHRSLFFACVGALLPFSILAQASEKSASPKVRLQLLPDAPKVDAATSQELLAWLGTLQNVVYRMNIRDYLNMVDWDALAESAVSGKEDKADEHGKARTKRTLIAVHQQMFPMIRPFFVFMEAEVRRIDIADGKAEIVARIRDDEDLEYKVRWWLRRHDGGWRMTDFENITASMRFSGLLLMATESAKAQPGQMKEWSRSFMRIGVAIQEEDYEKAYAIIKELEGNQLPGVLGEAYCMAKVGVVAQFDDKAEEFKAALDELEKAAPTHPMLYFMRAAMSHAEARYKDTIRWCQKLGSSVGHDEESWLMLVEAHKELKQHQQALTAAKAWAQDYPNSTAAVGFCWDLLPKNQREAVVTPLLEKIQPAETKLDTFAENAFDESDVDALKLVLGVMRSRSLPPEVVQEWQKNLEMLEEMLRDAKSASR